MFLWVCFTSVKFVNYSYISCCLISGSDDSWEAVRPQGCSPLLVFVNSKSGDNQGVKFLKRFKQLLNPAQVFDLIVSGPHLGWVWLFFFFYSVFSIKSYKLKHFHCVTLQLVNEGFFCSILDYSSLEDLTRLECWFVVAMVQLVGSCLK